MDIEYFFYYCMNKFRARKVRTILNNTGLLTKDENLITTALLFNEKNIFQYSPCHDSAGLIVTLITFLSIH